MRRANKMNDEAPKTARNLLQVRLSENETRNIKIGLARSTRANWKHGRYSAEAKRQARLPRQLLRECREQCRSITALCQ